MPRHPHTFRSVGADGRPFGAVAVIAVVFVFALFFFSILTHTFCMCATLHDCVCPSVTPIHPLTTPVCCGFVCGECGAPLRVCVRVRRGSSYPPRHALSSVRGECSGGAPSICARLHLDRSPLAFVCCQFRLVPLVQVDLGLKQSS